MRERFACERCWPDSADSAFEAARGLTRVAEPIDESHFHVMVRACPDCGQRFVSVFTETIDWVDGEDPQYWTMLPITDAEVSDLIEQGSALTDGALNGLGPDRKSLRHDYPKGGQPHNHWGMGMYVGQHD